MTPLEINVLKSVIANLESSTTTSWKTGDLDDWADFARKMKTTIKNNLPMLQALIDASANSEVDNRTSRDHPLTING